MSFISAERQVMVFFLYCLVDRLSDCMYVRNIPLYGYIDSPLRYMKEMAYWWCCHFSGFRKIEQKIHHSLFITNIVRRIFQCVSNRYFVVFLEGIGRAEVF